MKNLKKVLLLSIVLVLGGVFVFNQLEGEPNKSKPNNDLVLFGPVDYSEDNEDLDDTDKDTDDEGDDEGDWLSRLIETNKTPFSKTVVKE